MFFYPVLSHIYVCMYVCMYELNTVFNIFFFKKKTYFRFQSKVIKLRHLRIIIF